MEENMSSDSEMSGFSDMSAIPPLLPQDKTRQDNFITFAYTLMTDLAPQVAKLIEAGQEK